MELYKLIIVLSRSRVVAFVWALLDVYQPIPTFFARMEQLAHLLSSKQLNLKKTLIFAFF